MSGKQFWLGRRRAGNTLRFWADVDVIHLFVHGARINSLRSHLSVNDLARLPAAKPASVTTKHYARRVVGRDVQIAEGLDGEFCRSAVVRAVGTRGGHAR